MESTGFSFYYRLCSYIIRYSCRVYFITALPLILFNTSLLHAQINVGESSIAYSRENAGKLDDKTLDLFKNTTTIFVLHESQRDLLDDYKAAIESVWSFNKIEFIQEKDLAAYEGKPEYSFIQVMKHERFPPSQVAVNESFWLVYFMDAPGKRGKTERKFISVTELRRNVKYGQHGPTNFNKDSLSKRTAYINYTPGHLHLYTMFINKGLLVKAPHWIVAEEEMAEDDILLYGLANDTLYIPPHARKWEDAVKWNYEKDYDLVRDYEYAYKFVSQNEYEDRLLNSTKPTYVLVYVLELGSRKFFTVYNATSAQIVYSSVTFSNSLSSKDFSRLYKKVKKAISE